MALTVEFTKLSRSAKVPTRAHPTDAAYDLIAVESALLGPGERVSVGTGLSIALPQGYAALVLPRSGLAMKHGIALVNAPGLIDPEYRGELRILLLNTDRERGLEIAAGDRIAQLMLVEVNDVEFVECTELDETVRGAAGFGSTGV